MPRVCRLVLLPFLLGSNFGCPSTDTPPNEPDCRPENNCLAFGGSYECAPGYEWEDPNDDNNYNCLQTDQTHDDTASEESNATGETSANDDNTGADTEQNTERGDTSSDATADDETSTERTVVDETLAETQETAQETSEETAQETERTDETPCDADGFSSSGLSWSIPYPTDVFVNGYHAIRDINGDGLVDFVQHDGESTSTDSSIGVSEWRVYANTGSGFSSSGVSWSIPYPADVFSSGYHVVLDINADGLPDFVQCDGESTSTDSAIGDSEWRVYANTGNGFSSSGAAWAIPYPADVIANGYHAVLDINGDGLVDFVQYDGESTSTDSAIGDSEWRVYANTGNGFSSSGAAWAIPYAADVLGSGYHTVIDMTGDGLVDFVQHDAESTSTDSAIGDSEWRVYANTGSGFSLSGVSWSIPYPTDVFANGYHMLMDMNADGLLDFVQFDGESTSTDSAIGDSEWRVYANTGSGFSSSGVSWSIPYPADVVANGYHTISEVHGDGLIDFVQHHAESTSTDGDIGETEWRVFAGQCGS